MDADAFQKQIEAGRKALENARQALNPSQDVATAPNAEAQIPAHEKKAPKPRAPKPPSEVGGRGDAGYQPKPAEVPHDPPMYSPSDLWPQTNVILLEAQRRFPLQTQTVELCKHIVSEMTPLFVEVVKAGKMKAVNVLREHGGGMEDLLHLLLVHNDPGPHSGWGISNAAYRLGQEVRKSEEWLALAKAIAETQGEADSLRTGGNQTEPSRAQNSAQSVPKVESKSENAAPSKTPEAFIDRAIASRNRMLESFGVPEEARNANLPPALDAQKSRALLGIELARLEHLRRGVRKKFFDEARIPDVVKTEWQSALSMRKMPDSGVDLGLTFALTKEYEKAISRVSAQLADLLATAAGSRINQAQLREAIRRECLDFAYQLGQWDAFATWVHRAVHIGWQVLDADGQPSLTLDRESEKRLEERRKFFEGRIGMYSQEWLSAIDEAIDLRLTVSAPETFSPENNRKTAQSAESKSINAEQGAKSWQEIEIAFLSDERVEVFSSGSRITYNYAELGFEDRRNEKPNRAWMVLRDMAGHGGAIPRPMPGKERAMIQKRIEEIREKLRGHFGIGSDPIPFNRSRYQASFKISCRASFET